MTRGKMYSMISYVWLLCLIPLLAEKKDEDVRFHARQGLTLFIVEVGVSVLGIIPFLGGMIFKFGTFVCGLLSIAGIIQVLRGKKWKMPVIGDWAEQLTI